MLLVMKKTLKYIPAMCLLLLLVPCSGFADVDYAEQRKALVRNYIIREGIKDENTIRSMLTVPREQFVPENLRKSAYDNTPLPIGYGQTISQPYIVALMTELLSVDEDDRVLEIGTGSGYQAAILAHITKQVYTIEIIEPLANKAQKTIERLGYENISVKFGDGYYGWEEHAPFDAIIVTAAADHIPPPLIKQLKGGGKLCIPVGQPYFPQMLKLLEKDEKGRVRIRDILPVVFVPFTRKE
jgi:protein-L-isoaspartate(D-aspartate) O-methyltransferase